MDAIIRHILSAQLKISTFGITMKAKKQNTFLSFLIAFEVIFSICLLFTHQSQWIIPIGLCWAASSVLLIVPNTKRLLVSLHAFTLFAFQIDFTALVCMISLTQQMESSIKKLIIISLPTLFIWNYFSIIANTKVAITINTVITTFLAILQIGANTYFLYLPPNETFGIEQSLVLSVKSFGYTIPQIFQFFFGLFTVPLITVNGTATILCTLKNYWLEKHPEYHEISR